MRRVVNDEQGHAVVEQAFGDERVGQKARVLVGCDTEGGDGQIVDSAEWQAIPQRRWSARSTPT